MNQEGKNYCVVEENWRREKEGESGIEMMMVCACEKESKSKDTGNLSRSVIESEGSVCSNYRNRVCDYIKNRETI